jgi:hypothetical protein
MIRAAEHSGKHRSSSALATQPSPLPRVCAPHTTCDARSARSEVCSLSIVRATTASRMGNETSQRQHDKSKRSVSSSLSDGATWPAHRSAHRAPGGALGECVILARRTAFLCSQCQTDSRTASMTSFYFLSCARSAHAKAVYEAHISRCAPGSRATERNRTAATRRPRHSPTLCGGVPTRRSRGASCRQLVAD